MKLLKLSSAILVAFSITACASAGLGKRSKNFDRGALLARANNFYYSIQVRDFEEVYELLSPSMKQEISKEIFIEEMNIFFKQIVGFENRNLEIILLGEKLAVTQANVKLSFREESRDVSIESCERTVWLHYPNGWYAEDSGRTCEWMPDESQIKFLTQNIPDH